MYQNFISLEDISVPNSDGSRSTNIYVQYNGNSYILLGSVGYPNYGLSTYRLRMSSSNWFLFWNKLINFFFLGFGERINIRRNQLGTIAGKEYNKSNLFSSNKKVQVTITTFPGNLQLFRYFFFIVLLMFFF